MKWLDTSGQLQFYIDGRKGAGFITNPDPEHYAISLSWQSDGLHVIVNATDVGRVMMN